MDDPLSIEELRAQLESLRAEVAARPVAIPALPAEHDGEPLAWRPWAPAPFAIDHIDNSCPQCAHPGPHQMTFALAGPGKPVIRYQAHRCPSCQEMRVYRRETPRYGLSVQLSEIAYHPPTTHPPSDLTH